MKKAYLKWYNTCSSEEKKKLDLGETIIFQSSYGDLPISKRFSESSSAVELNLSSPINIDCPVRILHGVQDDSVPFENSIEIMKLLKSQDVDITFYEENVGMVDCIFVGVKGHVCTCQEVAFEL